MVIRIREAVLGGVTRSILNESAGLSCWGIEMVAALIAGLGHFVALFGFGISFGAL